MGEQVKRSGPEPLKLGTQLVSQRRPCADEILPRPGQRPQRLGLIAIGLEHPEAVMVGARQLAEHERVKPIGLPARDPKPIASRRNLVGMQRQDPQPRVQQPLDQQPVRPLEISGPDGSPSQTWWIRAKPEAPLRARMGDAVGLLLMEDRIESMREPRSAGGWPRAKGSRVGTPFLGFRAPNQPSITGSWPLPQIRRSNADN